MDFQQPNHSFQPLDANMPPTNSIASDLIGPDGNRLSALPLNTFQDIPLAGPNAQKIVALVKNNGRVSGYQLADGQVLDKQQAVALARQGGIRGVGIATRKGNEYLKSLPDDAEGNNLGNLPSISG